MHAHLGGSIVVCAPTLRPQGRISIERLRRVLDDTAHLVPAAGAARWEANTVRLGRASATFLSASPLAHVAGHTASIALIADEAQDIEVEWFERQFRPMAASTGAPTVLFGTPWDGRSLLDRAVAANRRRDQDRQRLASAVPLHYEVSWRDVAASRPAYGAYVRQQRAWLGANHPLFRTQYELRTAGDARRLLSAAQLARIDGSHPRLAGPLPGERYVAGLDLAGGGPGGDASVLTVGRAAAGRCEVVEHTAWHAQPYDDVIGAVVALARRWGLERLAVDATGLGGPLAARLADELGPVVEPVTFTTAVKSDLGFALQAAAETGRLAVYADDGSADARAVRAELAACGASLAPGRRLQWGNDRGHDDYVASLALCLRAAQSLGRPRVAVGRAR
ncbi:MAG: hypothetical protein Kow0010_13760 [Dehalococcoidia bacterium]